MPGRRLLKKGLVHKGCRRGTQPRQLFLFSDILIYTSPSLIEEHYNFHRIIPLSTLKIERESVEKYSRYCLKFITNDKSFLVFTGNLLFEFIDGEDEILEWEEMLLNAQTELQAVRRGSIRESICVEEENANQFTAPIWMPNSSASCCLVCGTHFNVFLRKVANF